MSDDFTIQNYERLVQLIRQIAREEAYKAVDEHLNEYQHKEGPKLKHRIRRKRGLIA